MTVGVASLSERNEAMQSALRGKARAKPGVFFISYDLMWRTLTPKRYALLAAMMGQGPMSIREAARRVERDVKAVHGDVKALGSFINKTDDNKIVFPYDEVQFEFRLNPKVETLSEFVASLKERQTKKVAA